MGQPTVYFDLSRFLKDGVFRKTMEKLVSATHGAALVDHVIDNNLVEATVAVVNTPEAALTIIKETEQTKILLVRFFGENVETLQQFAARFPNRVTFADLLAGPDEKNLVDVIEEMLKEAT